MRTTLRALVAFWCAVVLAGCPTTTTTTTTTTTSTTTSTVSTTTLSPDHTAPSAPSALTATPQSCGRIDLAWTGSTDAGGSGLRGYDVYRNGSFLKQVNGGVTTTSDTSVAASTVYGYTVVAIDNAGNASAASPAATTNTPACPDILPPSQPTGLGATATACSRIDLAWNPATDTGGSGLKGYNIYRDGVFRTFVASPTTAFADGGLPGSTVHSYAVAAIDNAGNASAQCAPASATTPACTGTDLTLLGFVPGVGTPFDVVIGPGGLVYVASGEFGLSIVDATTPSAPVVVGAANPPFYGQRVAVDGPLAVVSGRTLGMQVVDVTDVTAPRTIGSLGGDVGAVALVGQAAYALVTVPGNPSHVDLVVASLAAPSSPTIVGRVTVGVGAGNLKVVGSLAYVAAGSDGLVVVSVANPTAPVVVGMLDTPGTASDVAVADGYAYVADGSAVRVVSVSDPTRPVLTGSLAASASSLALAGTDLFTVDGMQFRSIDVAAPAAPVLLGSTNAYGASRLSASGSVAFLASSNMSPTQGGLYGWNVATPAAPAILARVNDVFDSRGVAVSGSLAVAAGASNGMKVVDLTDPAAPRVAGTLAGTIVAVTLADRTAYALLLVPGNPSHVDVLVVSLSGAPTVVGRLTLGSGGSVTGSDVKLVGSLLYVAASMAKLHVVSVASPSAPTLVGMVDLPSNASSLAVAGSSAYVACGTSVQVVDVSTPSHPAIAGSLATSASNVALAGTRLYAVDNVQLKVVDVTSPSAPALLGSVAAAGSQAVAAAGTLAYVATPGTGHGDFSGGVRAYDVSNGAAPILLDHLIVPGAARALTLAGGVLHAGDANGIVDVISVGP